MSTAAPPAAAPAAALAAAPANSPAGEPNAPQPGAQAAQPRTIKPIPPPRLPGVMEDGPEDASTPEAQAARARDAKGRFLKGGGETSEVVQKPRPSATDAPEGEPTIPDAPEAKPKFKFAGREFESPAAAEHWAKSMEGRYKPIQEAATRHEAQLVKAAESARGWHAEAQRLQARIAELEAGGGNPTPAAQPESAPAQGIDWALYAEIAKVANEAGEPWKAQQWLQEQYDANIRAEFARLREEAIENPRREAAQQAELAATADTLVNSMAAHTNPDGSPAFPEFRDGEQARQVGELWQSLGLDPRLALTPGGAVAAVALYRMARAMDAAAAPAPVPTPAPPPPNPAADAAAELEGGRPLMPAAASRREMDPSVARLVAGLKNRELIRPGLGFEA